MTDRTEEIRTQEDPAMLSLQQALDRMAEDVPEMPESFRMGWREAVRREAEGKVVPLRAEQKEETPDPPAAGRGRRLWRRGLSIAAAILLLAGGTLIGQDAVSFVKKPEAIPMASVSGTAQKTGGASVDTEKDALPQEEMSLTAARKSAVPLENGMEKDAGEAEKASSAEEAAEEAVLMADMAAEESEEIPEAALDEAAVMDEAYETEEAEEAMGMTSFAAEKSGMAPKTMVTMAVEAAATMTPEATATKTPEAAATKTPEAAATEMPAPNPEEEPAPSRESRPLRIIGICLLAGAVLICIALGITKKKK